MAEVTRTASDHTEHAASKALAAITRAALALGYRRLVSYTTVREAGTSYRAAGWHPVALTDGGEWSRPSRARKSAELPERKVRWETGPDAMPALTWWELVARIAHAQQQDAAKAAVAAERKAA